MRIDKYLWCIRVFKTRTLAAEQCKTAKVWVNDELIKPSRELKPHDVIRVRKGPVHFSFRVESFPTSRVGAKLVTQYAADVTPPDELKKLELIRMHMMNERSSGLGRPTKRDRRLLDDFLELDVERDDQ
ncbi:MAG: S4 domain-containing protein [Flavobacteriales bacterium]|nr:S4 domain-containing protein [Flavobacteriales bacterium]